VLCLALLLPTWFVGGRGAGWFWETANAAGFAALVLLLYLCIASGRGAGYERHRARGWCAVALTAIHAIWFLVLDPAVREYLKPAAPLYMWAGLIAALLLIALAASSGRRARRTLFERHFRNEHWWLGALALAGVAWHVAGSEIDKRRVLLPLWGGFAFVCSAARSSSVVSAAARRVLVIWRRVDPLLARRDDRERVPGVADVEADPAVGRELALRLEPGPGQRARAHAGRGATRSRRTRSGSARCSSDVLSGSMLETSQRPPS